MSVERELLWQIDRFNELQQQKMEYFNSFAIYSESFKENNPEKYNIMQQRIDNIRKCGMTLEVDKSSASVSPLQTCDDPFCPICIHERLELHKMLCSEIINNDMGYYTISRFDIPECYPEFLKENIELLYRSMYTLLDDCFSKENRKFFGGFSRLDMKIDSGLQSQGLPSCKPYLLLFMRTEDDYYKNIIDSYHDRRWKRTPFISPGICTQNVYTYKNGKWDIAFGTEKKYRNFSRWSPIHWNLRFKWQEIIGAPLDQGTLPVFCNIEPATTLSVHSKNYIINCVNCAYKRIMYDNIQQQYDEFVTSTLVEQCDELPIIDYHGTWNKKLHEIDPEKLFL